MELAPGETLEARIARGPLPLEEVLALALQIAEGLEAAGLGPAGLSHSPTITYRATVHGQLLGTVAYMSPEQAKGQPADRRSDLCLGRMLE